ncbi:vWA domain-containing protein [uncultured Desulfobulbus sp.]|uniref:vWA domain-containing protein n=1 Tax=uncultured Desulfobulbus sp. TaxID=239745 RepID=UPI00261454F0|nr:vWA domain-containing protein [uncultured Desulfobulbus sp.]
MKNGYSDITVVLDRSGSMACLVDEVIGAFNTFVDEQQQVAGQASFSLVQFDDRYEVYLDAVDLAKVGRLDRTTYVPRGMTALYDAVGRAIVATGTRLAALDEAERPDKVVFLIQTDGEENASHEYDAATLQAMIRHQQDKYAWEFVFLGANIDAGSVAEEIGIARDKALQYANNADGTRAAFAAVSDNLAGFRRGDRQHMAYAEEDREAQRKAGA